MFRFLIKRTFLAIIALFLLITIVYLIVGSFSKNPFASGNPETADQLADAAGLHRPILIRYFEYISGIFTGNFGEIYVPIGGQFSNIPEFFFKPLVWTLLITTPALVFSAVFGIFLGILAGYKRGTWVDTVINAFVVTFIGLPSFVLAPILILIAINSNGFILFDFKDPDRFGWLITFKSLALPIISITLGALAGYTILVRNQIVTALTSNHVLIAKSKGLSEIDIFLKHIVRNISPPIIAYIFPSFIILLAGNIIIEQFFQVPGTSTVITNAFPNGEINVVMFSIIFFSFISMISQILIDVFYVLIDPRIKLAKSQGKSKMKELMFWWKRCRKISEKSKIREKNMVKKNLKGDSL